MIPDECSILIEAKDSDYKTPFKETNQFRDSSKQQLIFYPQNQVKENNKIEWEYPILLQQLPLNSIKDKEELFLSNLTVNFFFFDILIFFNFFFFFFLFKLLIFSSSGLDDFKLYSMIEFKSEKFTVQILRPSNLVTLMSSALSIFFSLLAILFYKWVNKYLVELNENYLKNSEKSNTETNPITESNPQVKVFSSKGKTVKRFTKKKEDKTSEKFSF